MVKYKIRPWSKMETYMRKWDYFMSSFKINNFMYSVEFDKVMSVPYLPGRFDVIVNQGWRIYHTNTKNYNLIVHSILNDTQEYFPEANVKFTWLEDTEIPVAIIFIDNRKYNELRRTWDYANSLYAPYAFFIRFTPCKSEFVEKYLSNDYEFFDLDPTKFNSKFETVDQIVQISRDYLKGITKND